jgi:hypothetical protein
MSIASLHVMFVGDSSVGKSSLLLRTMSPNSAFPPSNYLYFSEESTIVYSDLRCAVRLHLQELSLHGDMAWERRAVQYIETQVR